MYGKVPKKGEGLYYTYSGGHITTRANIPLLTANDFTPERASLMATCGKSMWGTRLWRREAI
jgi:hypothetical protein